MRLRPGRKHYEHNEVVVRDKRSGAVGFVTRSCPAGEHIPAQAHVIFGDEKQGYHELWVPAKHLERVG